MPNDNRTIRAIVTNRKALHDYEVLQRIEAGIVLTGTEVKSLRAGKVAMTDAYAIFPSKKTDDLMLIGLHINAYDFGNRENHIATRERRLLLHAQELKKLRVGVEEKGLTLIPLRLYFSGPHIKVELGLVRGKKSYDKRATLKERENDREMKRAREE